jgi:hypothetical protein
VDANFGILIHWGVYSVPAFGNEWYARYMYVEGRPEFEHHRATYVPHTDVAMVRLNEIFDINRGRRIGQGRSPQVHAW